VKTISKVLTKGLISSLVLGLGFPSTSFGMSRLGAGLLSGIKRGAARRPAVAMAIAGTTAAGLGAKILHGARIRNLRIMCCAVFSLITANKIGGSAKIAKI
jgi:hypothetical protein